MASAQRQVMTVGHSNHAPQEFLMLLVRHGVTAVGDVRSSPYSQHVPHFNREPLKSLLNTVGIEYAFLGNELGGRPTDPALYDAQQRVRYDGIAATDIFRHGIERVLRGADRFLIALLCSEGEPLNCHRTLLVGEALAKRGVGVEHILTNGGLETHDHAMSRLLEIHKLALESVPVGARAEIIAEALTRQAEKFAYVSGQPAARDEWEPA